MVSVHHINGFDTDARRVHVGKQKCESFAPLGLRVRTDQNKDPVGPMGAGGPYFLPLDDIVVTFSYSGR